MVDDISQFFFPTPNIIIGKSIRIFMRKLNKVHDICVQYMSDKKSKGMTHNRL